jgi:5-methylthioadenosine/S-adenosylhomocysteine deaminase
MTSILVKDGIIVTMDPSHRILSDHSIIVSKDPNAIDAYTVLEMATIRGAQLYGLADELGSIELGKKADLIVVKPDILPTPLNRDSVVGHLINSISGCDVRTTILDGNVIMKERRVLTVDEERVQREAQNAAAGLWERLKTAKPQVEHIGTTSLMPR